MRANTDLLLYDVFTERAYTGNPLAVAVTVGGRAVRVGRCELRLPPDGG